MIVKNSKKEKNTVTLMSSSTPPSLKNMSTVHI